MSTPTINALSVRDLTKTYKNGVQALKGVDLDVEQAISLPSRPERRGQDDTDRHRDLTRQQERRAGERLRNDIDRDLEVAKSCIGVVPQEMNFNMFETPFTIVVNQAGFYGIPRPVARQRAEQYLKQLQLWDKRNTISRRAVGRNETAADDCAGAHA